MKNFSFLCRLLAGGQPVWPARFFLAVLLLAAPLLGRAQQYDVRTLAVTNITVNSATLGAQAYYASNPISPTGVAYRQGSGDPTTADMVVPMTVNYAAANCPCYSGTVQGLQPGKQYVARAFVATSSGPVYGGTRTFLTPALPYQPPLPAITVTPAAALLSAGGTVTLAASTILPGFNLTGSGLDGEVTAVLVLPDGKVLVGGSFTTYNGTAAAPARLLRFLADNSLDTGFNTSGAGPDGAVRALALQPDGKVLVGGDFTTYNGTAAPGRVLRLNADGSLDASFNNANGQLGTGLDGAVRALVRQPDGKVLVGGNFTAYNGAAAPGRVLRLNADGSLDTSFNNANGQLGAGPNALVLALALLPNGQVLVGGQFVTYNGTATSGRLLRLNADGSLDATFNASNGQSGTGFDSGVRVLLVQPNGQILVGGGSFVSYNGDTNASDRVLRLNADGSLDTSFNYGPATGTSVANGTSGTSTPAPVNALALLPNGQVLVGGQFSLYNGDANAPDNLLRLNADGSLDTSFNYGPATGTSVASGTSTPAPVNALALLPSGQVLVGGLFSLYNGDADAPDNLLRLTPNGSLDTSFTVVTTAPGLTYTWSTGATGPNLTVRQPGDYRVTATRQGRFYYSQLIRVSAAPATTVQVSPGGPLVLPAGGSIPLTATATRPGFNVGGAGFNGDVNALLLLPDGKVLAGGTFTTYNGTNVPKNLVRLNPDGSLDTSFNPGGTGFNVDVNALLLQPDGKVVVGGVFTTYNGTTVPQYLVRLQADGSLDTSFNNGGAGFDKAYAAAVGFTAAVFALALQPDGKIVVGGTFGVYNGNAQLRLLRLNPDGSLDAGFNYGGTGLDLVLPPLSGNGSSYLRFVRALAVQPNGKILVGGNFNNYNGGTVSRSLIRLNDDGTRDLSFNVGNDYGGIMHYDYPGQAGFVFALAVQPDGKIVVGGQFQQWNSQQGFVVTGNRLLRLNENGTYDASFNPPGLANINPADKSAGTPVRALAVQPDGKIVVGGEFTEYDLYNNPLSRTLYFRNRLLRLEPNGILNPTTDFSYPAVVYSPVASANTTSLGGANGTVNALALQPDGQVLVGGAFTAYHTNAATPDRLMRLTPAGPLNDAATPLAGATYAFNPGNTAGNPFAVSQPGTYTATATDPATGATYLSNTVVVTANPLPVTLLTFAATLAGPAAVRLTWATASEKNSAAFEVERSLDGRTFARIGTVAAAGTSSSAHTYGLLDGQLPAGAALLYYRLRQVDLDGTATYSPVRTVALTGAGAGLALFPNPARASATLTGAEPGATVAVLDALGRAVATVPADAAGTAVLALPPGLAAGLYVVRVGSQALRLTVE